MLQKWQSAQRVLCVRLDSLGDVVMTGPAIRALKGKSPRRHITLLTSAAGADAARLMGEIDEVLVYEAPWMKHTPLHSADADFAMIDLVRRQQFDAAVIFTVFSQNPLPAALLCFLAGVPLRLAHCRENPYQLLTNWLPEPEPQTCLRHEVQRQLDLVAAVGARAADERLDIVPPAEATRRVRSLLSELGVSQRQRWLVVHPGATAASRRYPPEMFAEAIQLLMDQHGFRAILTGSSAEMELIAEVQRSLRTPAISLAGELSLAETTALLSLAPLLLSNNTGPVHLAAAVGTPVVDLYALTNPQHTPWMVPCRVLNHDVPCRNCFKSICPEQHHHCLRLVEPREVVDAVVELWRETQSPIGSSFSTLVHTA